MHAPHRHRRRLAAVAALSALLLPLLPVAGPASPAAADPPAADAAVPGTNLRTELDPGTYQVTLLTGDQVRLVVSSDRHVTVDLEPAARPDGSTPEIEWYTSGDGVYVVPEDARPHLDAGLLDWRLFDVEHLAATGFTDDAGAGLPLIVEYAQGAGPATTRSAGVAAAGGPTAGLATAALTTATVEPLPSIGAAAVEFDRSETDDFWASLQDVWSFPAGGGRALMAAPAIEKVWLDDVATLALDESVPQVGAPQAWAAGLDGTGVTVAVLDSGIDATHPDVAGKVVATRDFVGDGDAVDNHGHGTHVATTIAGSGAASGGSLRGVAPGADLVIGKVCDDNGDCPSSAVIAGMQWAAVEQGADVINLSLGGCCTDGTDPMSDAVDLFSQLTGALFVTAAGNDGGLATIGSPGTADTALTVAAVDKSDQLADFSSRGPRRGDNGLKPEIAAPGVAIVAGRAAGTEMGTPVGDYYTAANGTSMATPHVAGAAALLAQQNPDWGGQRIKTALVSSAQDVGYAVYEVGAGRLDVARAIDQQVYISSPAVVDFQLVRPGDPPRIHTIAYTNPTAEPVTLHLAATLTAWPSGAVAPASALTLDADTLTVPAGSHATVRVSLDHSLLSVSRYSGSVVATAGDLRLTVPVGAVVGEQQELVTVTVTGLGCDDGVHCTGPSSSFGFGTLRFYRYDDVAGAATTTGLAAGPPPVAVQVPASARISAEVDDPISSVDVFVERGRYAVAWEPWWIDADTNRVQRPELWLPQVVIADELTLEMDAHQAVKVRHLPPQPVDDDGYASSRGYNRINEAGESSAGGGVSAFGHGNYWAYPSEPVTDGSFLLSFTDVLEAPQITMTLAGADPVRLHAIYPGYRDQVTGHSTAPVRFPEGTYSLPVVDVGIGAAQDYAGVDVAGKLVLLEQTGPDGSFCRVKEWQLAEALNAGAAGVLYNLKTCVAPGYIEPTPIEERPVISFVSLPRADAELIEARLQDGPVQLELTSTPQSPYTYYVKSYLRDGVPESLDFLYPHDQIMRVDANFHSPEDTWIHYIRTTWSPGEWFQIGQSHDFGVPTSQVQYLAPVGPDLTQVRRVSVPNRAPYPYPMIRRQEVFDTAGRTVEHWNPDPWVPGALEPDRGSYPFCIGCREGDMLLPFVRVVTGDPAVNLGEDIIGWGNWPGERTDPDPWAGLRVYRDGELVEPAFALGVPTLRYWPVPAEAADYRVELDLTGYTDDSYTEWEFRSGPTSPQEQVPDPYDCIVGDLIGQEGLTCRAEPFIFLRYAGLDTDLHNRVPAPGAHSFEVEAYRQETATPQPEIAGLRVWVSYDGGEHWRQAQVQAAGDGRYEVKVVHPPAQQRDSDSVTIRAQAWDAEGNRVEQTVFDAYQLIHRQPVECGPAACAVAPQ